MKLSRTKPSKVSFTVECQGQVDGPLDVRLVLGKEKKLSLKTESFGSDHVVMIPALQEHPWLLEGDTVPATVEVVCEKYYFTPMKKTLQVEAADVKHLEVPDEKEEEKPEAPAVPVITAAEETVIEEPVKEDPVIKKQAPGIAKAWLEAAAAIELEQQKKKQKSDELLAALRSVKK